jgi:hypothetical protein
MKTMFRAAIGAATMLSLLAGVQAAPVYFGDRTAFNAANTGSTLEDFEDWTAAGNIVGFATPVNSVSNVPGLVAPGQIAGGITFALTVGADAYFAAPNQSANPTNAIGVDTPTTAGWNLLFAAGTSSLAFDVFQNFGGGSQSGQDILVTVQLFGAGDALLDSFDVTVPSGSAGFYGVSTGTDLITRATINNVDSFDVIDNVAFNGVNIDVPEPMSLALVSLGLLGIGLSRCRKA